VQSPFCRPDANGVQRSFFKPIRTRHDRAAAALAAATLFLLAGCTGPLEYVRNGFKVGPDYKRPPAPVAEQWIDANDERVRSEATELSGWWNVFGDPTLSNLVVRASQQNLTLRQAGFRVLEARAQYGIARGNFFPQSQAAQGDFYRNALSRAQSNRSFIPNPYYSQYDFGFALAWELDFWGRFRRAIEAADANLNASVEGYDDVLVTLLGDVASNYVQLRSIEQQLVYVTTNIALQRETLGIAKARFQGGDATELDVEQAQSILSQTESQIPQLEIQRRQTSNALCVLLGIPLEDLATAIGRGPIPQAPAQVAIGIPADLLRRRPDVRRQERIAAAQAAQIGVAQADFYPAVSITGNIGVGAADFSDLFGGRALQGQVGPQFRWNLLNYGRILNNVRLQEARFQEYVAAYQQTVLQANRETENGLIQFLRAQQQAMYLATSVASAEKAVQVAAIQYRGGLTDYNRVATLQQNLVQQQNLYAQAQSSIALGLIQVYRALGGGWDLRLSGATAAGFAPLAPPANPVPAAPEPVPIVPRELPPAVGKAAPEAKP
jgi:NodT family efflux transporter outer membrane factor (OMF) lipoprotein